jgi:hypothetical protein
MRVNLDGVEVTEDEAPAVALDAEPPADDPTEDPAPAEVSANDEPQDADGLVVTFGDEPAPAEDEDPARAPGWVRDLRKANRDKDRRIRELEQRVAAASPQPAPVVVGPKPTLAGCDYDEDKFGEQLDKWHADKRAADEAERAKAQAVEGQKKAWQSRLDAYEQAKSALKVSDFDDAEDAARDVLSTVQQGVIVNGAENPALLVYALGRNPKKAKELAAITDPVRFAFAVAKLETQLKTTPRKTAPVPERVVRGSTPAANVADKVLEKLYEKAAASGDLTEVNRYKRQQREKQRA